MLVRRQVIEESIKQHKASLLAEKVKLKDQQREFGSFWKQQAEWRQKQRRDISSQPYDPESVWNIEGPTRRKTEDEKRAYDMSVLRNTLHNQAQFYRTAKESERIQDLTEGKRLCDEDLAKKDLERQLVAFKKQLFAQDMTQTWEKQIRYKKEIEKYDNEL